MFTLQKLNVVRIVATKEEKDRLIADGFIELVVEKEVKKAKKGKE